MSKEKLYIFDTTLRDGAQTQGVDFSLNDKEKISVALDNLGVDYIEGGWPGANPTDTEFFQKKHNFKNAKLTSFDTQKYGRQMIQINLGVVPTVANVYNQINNDTGKQIVVGTGTNNSANTSEQIAEKLVVKTKYVTSFRDRMKIKAAISPAKVQTITDTDGN